MHPHTHICVYAHTHSHRHDHMRRWTDPQLRSSNSPKPGTWQKDLETSQPHVPGLLGVIQRTWWGLLGVHLTVVQMRTHDPESLVPKPQRLSGYVHLVVPRTLWKNVHPTDTEFFLPNPRCSQLPADGTGCFPV